MGYVLPGVALCWVGPQYFVAWNRCSGIRTSRWWALKCDHLHAGRALKVPSLTLPTLRSGYLKDNSRVCPPWSHRAFTRCVLSGRSLSPFGEQCLDGCVQGARSCGLPRVLVGAVFLYRRLSSTKYSSGPHRLVRHGQIESVSNRPGVGVSP